MLGASGSADTDVRQQGAISPPHRDGIGQRRRFVALIHRCFASGATIAKLNTEINACLADPKMRALTADLGGTVLPGSPGDFGKLVAEETDKWAKVVESSGAKPG
jgi:hypothetical protein